jgi:hypothetical protein
MAETVKSNFEVAVEMVGKVIKGSKIVAQESKTGISYFQGKKRLVKVLKTKRGLVLEINVSLPKAMESTEGLDKISAAMAHKKHLGTMKYLYKAADTKAVPAILKAAMEQFKKDTEEPKQTEAK